jgi:hypothetical protein
MNSLEYYACAGPMSDPKDYAGQFDAFPADIADLCQIIQGLMVHIFWAERYGLSLSEERKQEVNIRSVSQQIRRILELDERPLTVSRPLEKRLVGNCRDFTLLLCAILRYQGIPARARCGFGNYFRPNHYVDHWVCEYWKADEARWVLVDPQLDQLMRNQLNFQFNPLDMSPGHFFTGGEAWQLCRQGKADPESFGIFDMQGLWFVQGDLMRDFLALNKVEILPWDGNQEFWEPGTEPSSREQKELEFLDHLATLSVAGTETFTEIRRLYADNSRFHIPKEWFSS